ncbi:CpaF/VirB11 family protein, partial [Enterococcus casseliflavus]
MVVIREKKSVFQDEKDVLRNVRNLVTTNQFRNVPSAAEEEQDDYLKKLVEDSRVEVIRDDLVEHYPDEVMRAFTSKV